MTREQALAMVQDLTEACVQREHAGSRAQYIKDDADFTAKAEDVVSALTGGLMGTKLEELRPEITPSVHYAGAQRLTFLCPLCRQRLVAVHIWSGRHCDLEYEPGKTLKLWHAEQGPHRDWATLSITPSIDTQHNKPSASGCTGWHGHITNGEAV